jgi:hypothetical protein
MVSKRVKECQYYWFNASTFSAINHDKNLVANIEYYYLAVIDYSAKHEVYFEWNLRNFIELLNFLRCTNSKHFESPAT